MVDLTVFSMTFEVALGVMSRAYCEAVLFNDWLLLFSAEETSALIFT